MQCIRNGGGEVSGEEDRKVPIKTEDRQKILPARSSEQDECPREENDSERVEKDRNDGPEVRTFVLAENQCIVYSPRGGEPVVAARLSSPPPPPPTRSSFPSHLPPKKTIKLALSMPVAAAALTVASGQGPTRRVSSPPSLLPPPPPPPPLALRSPEPGERMARIQIVSKAHQQNNDTGDEDCRGVLVGTGGGQGVHVIRDGRFYQPEPPEVGDPSSNQRMEPHRGSYEDRHLPRSLEEEEGLRRTQEEGRGPQHGSIIVVNGSASSIAASLSRIPSPGEDEERHRSPHNSHHTNTTNTTTILVTNDRPSAIYKPLTMATSSNATVSSSNKTPQHPPHHTHPNGLQHHHQQHQQPANGHVTSMQPPPPPPPLKQLSKGGGGGGHEEPSSSMPDLGECA
ncbi:ecdysone-induced protein 75C [Anopheles sinensis]|uniref:Ecdysone-induced protein 75C n=1 Tax=Anopheles sinensis TaxID=74873 RepID=A0A084WB80_ANOSI|nr:ecdysone-induced protein 75C [Anopheles sinensis]